MGHQYEMLTERNFYYNPSTYLITKISIIGQYDSIRFSQAVEELERVHPIISSIIKEEDDGRAYFVEKEGLRVPIKLFEKKDKDDWLLIATKEEKIPIVFDKEPALRFLIFHNNKEFDVVLLIHHIIADGMACKYLIQDLINIYCNNNFNMPIQPTRLIAGLDDLPYETRFPKVFIDQIHEVNEEWSKIRRKFTRQEYEKLFSDFYKEIDLGLHIESIEKHDYQTLIKRCKEHDITVNSALVNAILYAIREDREENQRITVAVNLRDYLQFDAKRCIATYAGCVDPIHKYNTDEEFWVNAVEVHKKIKEELNEPAKACAMLQLFMNLDGSLFDPMYFARNGTYRNEIVIKASQILGFSPNETGFDISNLGKIDISQEQGNYKITDYVFFANLAPVYDITIGVATLGEKLNLAICYKANNICEDKVKHYIKSAINELVQ